MEDSDTILDPLYSILNCSQTAGCPLLTARLPCGTGEIRCRCFLPDLTGFAAPPCTGPDYQQSASSQMNDLLTEYDEPSKESRSDSDSL